MLSLCYIYNGQETLTLQHNHSATLWVTEYSILSEPHEVATISWVVVH